LASMARIRLVAGTGGILDEWGNGVLGNVI